MPKKRQNTFRSRLVRSQNLNIVVLVLMTVGAVVAGYLLLRSSHARSSYAVNITAQVYNSAGANMSGVNVKITNVGVDPFWDQCTNGTDSNGNFNQQTSFAGRAYSYNASGYNIVWANCPVAVDGGPKEYRVDEISYPGWHVRSDSPIKVGFQWAVYRDPSGAWQVVGSNWVQPKIIMEEDDNDGDGVGNSADSCPNSAGPASNGGCPVPAPPPPAPTPSGCGAGTLNNQCVSINSFTANPASVAYNDRSTLAWSANYATGCSIVGRVSGGGSGSWATPNLTSTTGFTLSCSGQNSNPVTRSLTVNVAAPPAGGGAPSGGNPAPSPAPTIGKGQTATATKTSASTQKVAAAAPGGPAASDTQPPSAPTDLTAAANGSSIDLSWTASTDNVGVAGYTVERTTDGNKWDKVAENVTDTQYSDNDVSFGQKYTYRVFANDMSGNSSEAAVVDITSNAFQANVTPDADSVIEGADGHISIKIPAGAVNEPLYCEIVEDDDTKESIPKGRNLLLGPFRLNCKNVKGDAVTDFNSNTQYTVKVDAKGFTAQQVYFFNNDSWGAAKEIKYDSKQKQFTFENQTALPLMVLADKSSGSALWIVIVVVLLLAGLGFWFWRRQSSGGGGSYMADSYGASMMGTPAPKAPSPLDRVPTPSAPNPGAVSQPHGVDAGGHQPGQHQIDVSPVQGHSGPFHNPLDRLAETERQSAPDLKAPGDTSANKADLLDSLKAPGEGMDK